MCLGQALGELIIRVFIPEVGERVRRISCLLECKSLGCASLSHSGASEFSVIMLFDCGPGTGWPNRRNVIPSSCQISRLGTMGAGFARPTRNRHEMEGPFSAPHTLGAPPIRIASPGLRCGSCAHLAVPIPQSDPGMRRELDLRVRLDSQLALFALMSADMAAVKSSS